jgi:hypothetical protein
MKMRGWYLVLEAWHPFPHLGLDGFAWPVRDIDELELVESAMQPLPFAPGGALFEGCFDRERAMAYFEAAAVRIERVYLIEVRGLDAMAGCDGLDVGRPDGGFSIAGQEICKTPEGHARFGHLLNEHGLFPDDEALNTYLVDRRRRVDVEGLEHLDESIAVRIRILRQGGLRQPA